MGVQTWYHRARLVAENFEVGDRKFGLRGFPGLGDASRAVYGRPGAFRRRCQIGPIVSFKLPLTLLFNLRRVFAFSTSVARRDLVPADE